MAKRLEKWLDEFVENGADAKQVTEWPDNAGGAETHFPAYGEAKKWYFYPRELLKCLIKSGVDVDAGISESDLTYMSVAFGLAYYFGDNGFEAYSPSNGDLYISLNSGYVYVNLIGYSSQTRVDYLQTPEAYTYRTILEALPEKVELETFTTADNIIFVGQLYVDTNSTQTQRYDLSGDDFFSFFKYEEEVEEVEEETPTVTPVIPTPKPIPVGN